MTVLVNVEKGNKDLFRKDTCVLLEDKNLKIFLFSSVDFQNISLVDFQNISLVDFHNISLVDFQNIVIENNIECGQIIQYSLLPKKNNQA